MSDENASAIGPDQTSPVATDSAEAARDNLNASPADIVTPRRPADADTAASPTRIPAVEGGGLTPDGPRDTDADPSASAASGEAVSSENVPVSSGEEHSNDEAEAARDGRVSLNMAILDFAGEPISGLRYRILVGKDVYNGTTCSKGNASEISDIEPYQPLEILVRKANGEFVSKYKGYTECADMNVCAVSPHIKVSMETEPHAGQPESAAAPVVAKPVASQEVKAKTVQPVSPVAPGAAQIAGGGKPLTKEPSVCRNEAGHPQASLKERTADWAKRHQIPTFGLWSWDDFKSGATGCTKPATAVPQAEKAPGKAAPATAPPAPPSKGTMGAPPSVRSATQAAPAEIKKLIDIMEEQTTWQWKQMFEIDKYTSAGIKVAILNKTFTPTTGKSTAKFDGRCYPSVKIGLWRAGLVTGYGDDIPAKGAGKWLLSQGFREVSNITADARWALPGDVIVYRYSDEVEERNRKAVTTAQAKYEKDKEAYDLRKAEYTKAISIWEADIAHRKRDREEAKRSKMKYTGGADPKKPVIGPEPKPPNDGNYGHIDVRTYDAYISDARAERLPNTSKFVVSGIYRKVFDPLPDLRVRAFLKVLREWECHGIEDRARYFVLQQKIDGKNTFSDTTTHPWAGRTGSGTFAGAYQIRIATWEAQVKLGLPSDFSPATQDMMAVSLIEGRGALGKIRQGEIADAVALLSKEWTSLPGGADTRHEMRNKVNYVFTINDVLQRYNEFLKELIGN